jgi:hypothetical protein
MDSEIVRNKYTILFLIMQIILSTTESCLYPEMNRKITQNLRMNPGGINDKTITNAAPVSHADRGKRSLVRAFDKVLLVVAPVNVIALTGSL